MKQLSEYINEKLILNKDIFKNNYKYFPKTKNELKEIIEQLLEERKDNDVIYLNDIDTSEITNMSKLFYNNDNIIKIDISNWNISKVTDMFAMFKFCKNLKSVGDLSKWNVSKVEDMEGMFEHCYKLKNVGNLNKWNVKESTNMYDMFLFSLINIPKWYKE